MPRMIGPGVAHGSKANGRKVLEGKVLSRGDKGYDGPLGDAGNRKSWEKIHDDVTGYQQRSQKLADDLGRIDRTAGKQMLGLVGAGAAAGTGMGLLGRAVTNRENTKLRRQIKKSFRRDKPFMWVAEKGKDGVYDATILGKKPPQPREDKSALRRFGRWAGTENGSTAVALGATGALVAPTTALMHGPAKENERLKSQLERKRRRTKIAKAKTQPTPEQIEASRARRAAQQAEAAARKEKVANTPKGGIWTGKPLSETWRNHIHRGSVRNALISTGIAAGATGGYLVAKPKVAKADDRRRSTLATLAGATAGAASMDALNTVGGQSAKAVLKERRNRRGLSPNEEARWAQHKKTVLGTKAGQPVPNDDSVPQAKKAELYRTAPKGSIPDRTANRLLAFKNTKGWTAGSLVGAGLVGGTVAHRKVSKSADDLAGLPRAARRAAKKGKQPLSAEEIAQRRAEAEARRAAAGPKPPKAEVPKQQAAPSPAAAPERPRSSFLGRGQVRDLAIGVPLGLGALAYGTSRPKEKVGKAEEKGRRRARQVAAGAGLGAVAAHAGEGRALKLSERELARVISANNADGVGQGDFHPDQPRIDRGIHARRSVSQLDNARLLRGGKTALGALAVGAGYQGVKKSDDRRRDALKTGAGAVGGAALLDSADTLAGAGLKRVARSRFDSAMAATDDEGRARINNRVREHAKEHGFTDKRGRGRLPKPDEPHAQKNRFYRSYPLEVPGGRLQRLNALRDKKTPLVLGAGALIGGGAAASRQRVSKAGLGFAVAGGATGSGALGLAAGRRSKGDKEAAKEALGGAAGGWAAQGLYQGAGYGAKWKARGIGGSKVPRIEQPGLKANAKDFPDKAERAKRAKHIREMRAHKEKYGDSISRKRNYPKHWHGAKTERVLAWTHGGRTGTALGGALTAGGAFLGAEAASSKKSPLDSRVHKRDRGDVSGREYLTRQLVSNDVDELKAWRKRGRKLGKTKRYSGKRSVNSPYTGAEDYDYDKFKEHLRDAPRLQAKLPRHKRKRVIIESDFENGLYVAKIAKSREYGYMDRKRNPQRTAQAAAGAGLLAYGLPRSRAVGSAVARGVKLLPEHGKVVTEVISETGRYARQVTAHGERFARKNRQFDAAFRATKPETRANLAVGTGALVAARAHPTHDERFTPTGRF